MTYYINSKEARNYSRANLNIFNETTTLMRSVMEAADNGDYSIVVSDGTLMTESTPDITITGTVTSPVITNGDTVIIAGETVVLGTSGTNLNSIIADINDAEIPNLIASKTSDDKLLLTYTTSETSWDVTVGAGTANIDLGLAAGVKYADPPISVSYYNSWQGVATNRKYDDEIANVLSFFENLGYNISISENTSTVNTFVWNIYW